MNNANFMSCKLYSNFAAIIQKENPLISLKIWLNKSMEKK